jgi:hypothetical protein
MRMFKHFQNVTQALIDVQQYRRKINMIIETIYSYIKIAVKVLFFDLVLKIKVKVNVA